LSAHVEACGASISHRGWKLTVVDENIKRAEVGVARVYGRRVVKGFVEG
jgi:hypothetical protein